MRHNKMKKGIKKASLGGGSLRTPFFYRKVGEEIVIYLLIVGIAALLFLPFVYMILTAFKTFDQTQKFPIEWIPQPFQWNLPRTLKITEDYGGGLLGMYWHSVIVTGLGIAGQVLSCAIIGFGFARFKARLREPLFFLFLATIMLPTEVTQIPLFLLFCKIGWMNSYKPLIVPLWFGSPIFIFLVRQYIRTIPKQLDDAAYIDGANSLHVFFYVILPLIKPVLGVVTIFSFMGSWNDLMGPLIYLQDMSKYTLPLGLAMVNATAFDAIMPLYNILMMFTLLTIIPCVVIFLAFQRFFVRGIVLTGFKG